MSNRKPRWSWALAGLMATAVICIPLAAQAVTMDVTYSFRMIPNIDPPAPDYPEGGFKATLIADVPVWPTDEDPDLERISDRMFRFTFQWNDAVARTFGFFDAAQETVVVTLWPELVLPFDPAAHTVPVIHVQTDSTHLWDPETGLYVWGNYDNCFQHGVEWERPATFNLIAPGGVLLATEPVGLRINGGWSRNLDQKGLRFYFDDYGTQDQFQYDFFGSEPTSFRRLIARTCRYYILALNSTIGEDLFLDLGRLGSRSAPVVVYLNREYWGTYNLRERLDDEFVEHTHGIQDSYVLMKDGDPVHGDPAVFYDFLASFGDVVDHTSHNWYVAVQDQLDIPSYVDWLLINIYGASADNGFDDNSAQLKVGSDPWQFLIWDEDDLFRSENLHANLFRFLSAADEAEWYAFQPPLAYFGPWTPAIQEWATMFNALMHNSEFKAYFFNRMDELLANEMSVAALHERIDALTAVQGPLMQLHHTRWFGGSEIGYYVHADNIKNWIEQRLPIFLDQKEAFWDHFRVPVELSQFTAQADGDVVHLAWRTERETGNRGFVVLRSVGTPDAMAPIASYLTHPELTGQIDSDTPSVYGFIDTTAEAGQLNYYQLQHVDTDDLTTDHHWIEQALPDGADPGVLVINEFMASNTSTIQDEAGEYDDWLEIYNPGPAMVAMSDLILTDDLTNTDKWAFPDTTLPAGGFLLVWCDEDQGQGPLHTNFKLSAGGEEVGLFHRIEDGNGPIDTYVFGPQTADVSEGRESDGSLPWVFFTQPTPGASNGGLSPVAMEMPGALVLQPNYPNPFNPSTTLAFALPQPGRVRLTIHDLRGHCVASLVDEDLAAGSHRVDWHGRDRDGRLLASGAYLARLDAAGEQRWRRLLLLK